MIGFLFRRFPFKWLFLATVLFLLLQLIIFLLADPQPLTPEQTEAFQRETRRVLTTLPPRPGTEGEVGVVRLLNDPSGEGTDLLKTELGQIPGWTVADDTPFQRFFREIADNLRNATTPGEIAFAGREVDLPVIAMGRIEQLPTPETPTLKLWLGFYDTRAGSWLHKQTHTRTWTPEAYATLTLPDNTLPTSAPRPLTSKLAWLLAVFLLPFLAWPLFLRLLDRNSNRLNAASLLALGLAATLIVSWAFQLQGIREGKWVVPGLLLLLLSLYNYAVLEFLAKRHA